MASEATPKDESTASTTKKSQGSTSSRSTMLLASYVMIVGLWAITQKVMIPYYIHLVLLVSAIMYAACHHSLVLREDKDSSSSSSEGGISSSQGEVLKKEDAYQFPLFGSASLFSLYLAFKFLDKELVNLLIGLYFCAIGCVALYATIAPPSYGPSISMDWKYEHRLLPKFMSPLEIQFNVSACEILVFIGCMIFCGFYFSTKHWALNNILGICFCLQGIERFSLGTYKIGAILLIGLFFYDIFWVFGTDVMVTVAKNLDGPIKILFPRGINEETGKTEFSLLGLGDIVIPGFFLALLLRFDAHKADAPMANIHASFPKPYFMWAFASYVLGLCTTLYVMIVFHAAQPALLYLVPACLGSSFLCAVVRGEVKDLLEYSEEEEEEEKEKDKDGDDKKDAKKSEEAKKKD